MSDLKALVADIVGSYLTHNKLAPDQVPALIGDTYAALVGAVDGKPAEAAADDARKPTAAQIRKSVTDDQITCLICGQGFKSMKRHLSAAHGMSPIGYRTALGLKSDYPTVAPAYAQHRSDYAKSIGLGRGGKGGSPAPVAPAPAAAPVPAEAPKAAVSKAAKPPKAPKAAKSAPKTPAKAKRTAATAADRPPIKPAVAARPPGAIDPASDSFE
jgi:predicted transcriptional regulator